MIFDTHGRIKCGTSLVPDLESALGDYAGVLGLEVAESGQVPADLAASWAAPAAAGRPYALLRPQSGAPCFLRLIEAPIPDSFRPTRTFGWAAYELTVQDVFGWPQRLVGSGFDIVGPPREIEGLPYFVPMQVTGRGREMLYLNEVHENTPSADLPKALSPADHIFIVILAAPDRERAVAWYKDRLDLDEGGTYTLEYTMINNAFDLPEGTQSSITMVQSGRLPIVEVDDYPDAAKERPAEPEMLPPGNSMVTLAVCALDELQLDWTTPPEKRPGPLYEGRRVATTFGPAGERLELVEVGG